MRSALKPSRGDERAQRVEARLALVFATNARATADFDADQVRVKHEGRNPEPSAGIIDSQSVKGADTVPTETRGYDAGKKINGRNRHIVVDTIGLLLVVMVTAASVQDRDGARGTLKRLRSALSSVSHIFADGGYSGQLLAVAKSAWSIVIEIVRKPADQTGFAVAGWWSARSPG